MPFTRIVHVVDNEAARWSLSRLLWSAGFKPTRFENSFKLRDIAPELTGEVDVGLRCQARHGADSLFEAVRAAVLARR
jgi:hypothetical protein